MTISIETAVSYLESGLSCLPASRERKHPTLREWKTWMGRLPTRIEVEAWFANAHDAICIVAGKVSGNLECMDFDNHGEQFAAWMEKIDTQLLSKLVVEQTPSGGYHVFYRSIKEIEGNLKLSRGMRDGKLSTLIETRGEGGLFLCAPSEGYVLQQGSFEGITEITPEERERLLNAARALDETPPQTSAFGPCEGTSGRISAFSARPGDDFCERGDIRPYLSAAGWQMIGNRGDNELWRRPGKNSGGHSATFDGSVFYVFSSNAAPFESGEGYSKFQTYSLLEHRGDFTEAARSLLAKGYGTTEDPLLGVDLTHFNPPVGVTGEEAKPIAPEAVDDDIPVDVLLDRYPKMRPVLIHGFLRLGETMNIIAPPKTGKSWLVTDLALSVATGTPWFGFPCEQGRVLIIDNELHCETSASRIPKVIAERGFDIRNVGKNLSIVNQRGKLKSILDLGNKVEHYKREGYKLIIIDAFYRAMPVGTDENDNGAIAGIYNVLDRYAAEIGCAFVLIHHTSKGNQSLKAVTDVGSGAGSQSRAADTHVILRRHKEPDAVVMESVVRSFPSLDPVCLRWRWPLWYRDDGLNPADLEGKQEMKSNRTGTDEIVEMEEILSKIPEMVDPSKPDSKTLFIAKLQKKFDLSRTKTREVFDLAVAQGVILCERLPDSPNSQHSTKFVLLPSDGGAREGDEEDEDEG